MKKIIISAVSLALFGTVYYFFDGKFTDYRMSLVTLAELVFLGCAIGVFLPKSERKATEKREKSFSVWGTVCTRRCQHLLKCTAQSGEASLVRFR